MFSLGSNWLKYYDTSRMVNQITYPAVSYSPKVVMARGDVCDGVRRYHYKKSKHSLHICVLQSLNTDVFNLNH